MPTFTERVLLLTGALEEAGIPYAIGGAIALGYYAEPRATKDIDVNIFLGEDEAERVLQVILDVGGQFGLEQMLARVQREGQVRLPWDPSPEIDLFFSTVPFHEDCRRRARRLPLDGGEITVLSAEDLAICKIAFNRAKDWTDLWQMIATQGEAFDIEYVRRWLRAMFGAQSLELQKFEAVLTGELPL